MHILHGVIGRPSGPAKPVGCGSDPYEPVAGFHARPIAPPRMPRTSPTTNPPAKLTMLVTENMRTTMPHATCWLGEEARRMNPPATDPARRAAAGGEGGKAPLPTCGFPPRP